MKTLSDSVLINMRPFTYYRPVDLASETRINRSSISKSLLELSRGGVIDRIKDGKRCVYLTKQSSLFFE